MDTETLKRLKMERNELRTKVIKLREFIKTDKFDMLIEKKRHLLRSQIVVMERYSGILSQRIDME